MAVTVCECSAYMFALASTFDYTPSGDSSHVGPEPRVGYVKCERSPLTWGMSSVSGSPLTSVAFMCPHL